MFDGRFQPYLYYKLLQFYKAALPFSIRQQDTANKSSAGYLLYIELLEEYVRILKKIGAADAKVLMTFQEIQLQHVLKQAAKTRWWQTYFQSHNLDFKKIKRLADLENLPPITRISLIDSPKEDFIAKTLLEKDIIWGKSSGSTTGTPFVWGSPKASWEVDELAHYIRNLEDYSFLFSKNKYKNFYLHLNYAGTNEPFKHFFLGNFYLINYDKNVNEAVLNIVKTMQENPDCILRCAPSELVFFIHKLQELHLQVPVVFCSTTGQPLTEETRIFAENYLRCPVRPVYGTQELGGIAMACKDHPTLMHILSERAIVEIIDEDQKNVPEGELGNITVTSLENTFMPLIRYQPGDVGRLHTTRICSCANQSPLLEIEGRNSDFIQFRDKRKVPITRILRLFGNEPFLSKIRRIQLQQQKLDEVIILLENKGGPLGSAVIESLKKVLEKKYPGMAVSIKQTSLIAQEGKKFKTFLPMNQVPT